MSYINICTYFFQTFIIIIYLIYYYYYYCIVFFLTLFCLPVFLSQSFSSFLMYVFSFVFK